VPELSNGFALGLLIIPILAFLIIVHELGHFFAARSVGVKVEEFGLGIPPRAKGWTRNGVIWSLNWIPFGGFVRVKGEDGTDMGEGSMNRKGPLQRAFFLAAGSAMNFLVAIIVSILLVAFQGVPDNTDRIYVASVSTDSPAEGAGWLPGDAIVAVDGEEITSSGQLQTAINDHRGEDVEVTIRRGDQIVETHLTPRENPPRNQGATGIQMVPGSPSSLRITEVLPGSAAADAGWQRDDSIIAIDGIQVEAEAQARGLFMTNAGKAIPVTIERDGERIETTVNVPTPAVTITQVANDSPASEALLYAGDEISTIAGKPVTNGQAFADLLLANKGKAVPVEVVREGRTLELTLAIPNATPDQDIVRLVGVNGHVESPYEALGTDGIIARTYDDVPASEVVQEGWSQFWWMTTATVDGMQRMVTDGVDRDQVMGPIGMGQLTSETLSTSAIPAWVTLGTIMMAISLGLGVLNLLPLPALDGGRLLFVLIEVLRGGRRVSPEKEGLVHLAGMVVLLGLMFFVAYGDVSRIVDGRSIIP
jgi:regulator of sigma E protease